jgi:L-rhamnose mutarotase
MRRFGFAIGIRPETLQEYIRLHSDVWPGVLAKISECNIRNYSIFLREPENILFAYYEYHGEDHDADLAKMALDPTTQEWWALCKPMQQPLEPRKPGDWWAELPSVFHLD